STGISAIGTSGVMPTLLGSIYAGTINSISNAPRLRLGDLVSPVDDKGRIDRGGNFKRAGASLVTREQGERFIAIKFSVRGRDLASAVADAKAKTADLVHLPYRMDWSGEFQEMEEAMHRLMMVVPVAFVLIFVLLYLAFHSLIDTLLVLSNV